MKDISAVFNAHPQYIESLYQSWLKDPESVESDWAVFFKGFDFALSSANGNGAATTATATDFGREFAVMALIHGYRNRGHMLSDTNPVKERKDRHPKLALSDYGLSDADLDKSFAAGAEVGMPNAPLRDIIAHLKKIYCGKIGFETTHIYDKDRLYWLRKRVEQRDLSDDFGFPVEKKQRILEKLNGSVVFEQFLHTKFVGQKRFSLEGGEATIPALDAIITAASESEIPVEEIVIGMAHRGRLNVLANILGKTYEQIFSEFESKTIPDLSFGDGDVKYHLGFSSQVKTLHGKEVYLKLLPNPSHLEAVDPVVLGFARAKADALYSSEYDHILPILIHGDAALAGQGIVYEITQMSQLPGYYTGGTIHFVINNQIGFTTGWDEGRSSTYCTQVAEVVQAPVFHVNGDDPEAVVFAVELATAYRQEFNSDVYIDMVCYRRYGHNESDEPRFTQPDLYETIAKHPNPREVYNDMLINRGDVDQQMAKNMEKAFRSELQDRLDNARQNPLPYVYQETELAWKALTFSREDADFQESPETGISRKEIDLLLNHLLNLPEDFRPLPQITKLLQNQRKLVEDGQIDWALGELLAYGSLLLEGKDVRMSGQDVKRGTFSHRHACPVDAESYERINRLDKIAQNQGRFLIYNSLLSEYAVLGFEYGYAYANPDALVVWEAQFGDFANGASTIIDQFIFAAEAKWRRMNGLVMLLPHGYEGQGPEHSSARLERFLQLCAWNNVTIANSTSASNFFHLLRRQLARPFRKPLIVMSPKSTLRAPYNLGLISEIEHGTRFQELLDDPQADPKKVKRLLVCSGKVYYDLAKRREEEKRQDVAIVRLEQIYPFPKVQFDALLKKYNNAKLFWVQEEPANAGAWSYLLLHHMEYGWTRVSRPFTASPATGYPKKHEKEQLDLINQAFAD
ncbi:MAG: 2-oxoglutarate dehydrogenase E1 component [Bacteroidetes bacterium]|nr:MAG: 2-oxoglutarate dehydrogenase E1 component [Bacteroidota bacterium]